MAKPTPTPTPTPTPAPEPRKGMYIDANRCIGCNSCSMACKQENGQNGLGYGKWNFTPGGEKGQYPTPDVRIYALTCMQCWDAPCKAACPHGAIIERPDGIKYIDQTKCTGCRQCEPACPYKGVLNFNPNTNKMEKCHFCMHRIDQGLQPACVITCLTATREFGNLSDLQTKHPSATDMGTKVSIIYENFATGKVYGSTPNYVQCKQCH